MKKAVIQNLKEKLFNHYKDFQKENLFIDSEEEFINIYNYVYFDEFISEKKIIQIKNFIEKYLLKHKEEGYFYICGYSFKVGGLK